MTKEVQQGTDDEGMKIGNQVSQDTASTLQLREKTQDDMVINDRVKEARHGKWTYQKQELLLKAARDGATTGLI
ncbi:hypothetical protein CEXT_720711 [Caerostris extrusa]|uniref:Uncharacterized protein n=1 Tax=Caerostris extrusa TaxID=172846 RepID=A0AAV4R0Z1_CAEEX|nr:hypothetical protein CEXT_720711 [Caerostris extrusa]